jgi:hypothetical protein
MLRRKLSDNWLVLASIYYFGRKVDDYDARRRKYEEIERLKMQLANCHLAKMTSTVKMIEDEIQKLKDQKKLPEAPPDTTFVQIIVLGPEDQLAECVGESILHKNDKDNYRAKTGRKIARRRALKVLWARSDIPLHIKVEVFACVLRRTLQEMQEMMGVPVTAATEHIEPTKKPIAKTRRRRGRMRRKETPKPAVETVETIAK